MAAGLTVLALLGAPGSARAQESGGSLAGQRVQITSREAGSTIGVLVNVTPEMLTIAPERGGAPVAIRRTDVMDVRLSRGTKRYTLHGLLAGAAAWGAVVGIVAAVDTLDESGVGEPVFIGGVLAAGAGIGSLIRRERWERIPESRLSVSLDPVARGAVARVAWRF